MTEGTNYLNAQENKSYNVFFSSGISLLTPNEKLKLANHIKAIDNTLVSHISIYGYCDDEGSFEFNNVLSLNRAKVVKNLLIELNIDSGLITNIEGKGKLPLLNSINEDIEKQRAFNRRAEIIIIMQPRKPKHVVERVTDSVIVSKKQITNNRPPNDLKAKDTISKRDMDSAIISKKEKSFNDDLQIGDTIVFGNILFVDNKHKFLPGSYPVLDTLVSALKRKKQYHILVMGHICCTPPGYKKDALDAETGLLNLSEARAKAVVDYLNKKGIKSKRLTYKGLKGDYHTGKGALYDRRVEIKITDIQY